MQNFSMKYLAPLMLCLNTIGTALCLIMLFAYSSLSHQSIIGSALWFMFNAASDVFFFARPSFPSVLFEFGVLLYMTGNAIWNYLIVSKKEAVSAFKKFLYIFNLIVAVCAILWLPLSIFTLFGPTRYFSLLSSGATLLFCASNFLLVERSKAKTKSGLEVSA